MTDAQEASGGQRLLAMLAYLGPMVVVPLLVRRKHRFAWYHTRQGLYLFVIVVVALLVTVLLLYVFGDQVLDVYVVFRGLAVVLLLELVVYAAAVLWLAVQSMRGRMPMLPVLGELAGEV